MFIAKFLKKRKVVTKEKWRNFRGCSEMPNRQANVKHSKSPDKGIVELVHGSSTNEEASDDQDSVMKRVEKNIIGKDLVYDGPFGKRTVVYCDYTASGKSIDLIEDYIRHIVLPYYGNTHTTTNVSSSQTSKWRTEAKQIIRKCTNATEKDAVIFVGNGTTGAILKLIHALELNDSPVVFISPFEHHSNLLPWLEIGAEIVYGEENQIGEMDLGILEENVKKYSKTGRPLVGSFSAASNITGILNDTEALATIMHRYNGYAFFDYATAGPYVEVDMNPNNSDKTKDSLCYKDAIFCSIHKFVGGPGTPGLLIAKKNLFVNPVPGGVGGGTVLFVTHNKHEYVTDIEEREEGGTPAIVESIRAGLVFQLKHKVTSQKIMTQEHKLVKMAYVKWESINTLHILGKSSADRLSIFSLVFEHPISKRFLHHNFISSLFNDLFGIQTRGGCACAGPYAEDLLGIDNDTAVNITQALLGNYSKWSSYIKKDDGKKADGKSFSVLKPGFTRLNLPYFLNMDAINFILDAVVFVAKHGWKFLPTYEMNPTTGDFTHKESQALVCSTRLTNFMKFPNIINKNENHSVPDFKEVLRQARLQCDEQFKKAEKTEYFKPDYFLPKFLDRIMRWFVLPSEIHALLRGEKVESLLEYTPMFYPRPLTALSNVNKLKRTRIKSGLKNLKYCNCLMKKKRHVQGSRCLKYLKQEGDNDIEKVTLDNSAVSSGEKDEKISA